jgi:host factor-I protein
MPLPDKREHLEKQQNIQDAFLNSARKERTVVSVYLVSGAKLTGRIRSFDKYSLVLESSNQEQLIFKHAISTVVLPRTGSVTGFVAAAAAPASAGASAAASPSAPAASSSGHRQEG